MSVVILKHNTLLNSEEVNEFGWSVAKYKMVKVAEATDIDAKGEEAASLAYIQSQSIGRHWHESANHFWTKYFSGRSVTRSTMVGDSVEVDGVDYRVDSFGFSVIEKE